MLIAQRDRRRRLRCRAAPARVQLEQPALVFAGTFSAGTANVDATAWLLDEVMPLVWRRRPDVHLYLVGRHPAPAIVARASARVHVTGEVPAIVPYLRASSAALVPLRWESGTRFKILEAFACRTPVDLDHAGRRRAGRRARPRRAAGRRAATVCRRRSWRCSTSRALGQRLVEPAYELVRREYDVSSAARQINAVLARLGLRLGAGRVTRRIAHRLPARQHRYRAQLDRRGRGCSPSTATTSTCSPIPRPASPRRASPRRAFASARWASRAWPSNRRPACASVVKRAGWLPGAARAPLLRGYRALGAGLAHGSRLAARARGAVRADGRRRIACVIGVDPDGLALAHDLAHGAPVGYYSLELLLSYEVSDRRRGAAQSQERELSRQAAFVVVQDEAPRAPAGRRQRSALGAAGAGAQRAARPGPPPAVGLLARAVRLAARRRASCCTRAVWATGPASRRSSTRPPTGRSRGCWSSTPATTPSRRPTSTGCASAPTRAGCSFRSTRCRARTTMR